MLEETSGDDVVLAPCLKHVQLQQVAQGHIQLSFEYLQR